MLGIHELTGVSNYHHRNTIIDEEMRTVILGETGCRKSAIQNSSLSAKKFQTKLSGSYVTHFCSQNSAIRFNRKIVIVDTQGIFDTKGSNEKVQEEIYKCIGIKSPGPCAFVLVLNIVDIFT